jgi:hypothetical protein
VLRGQERGELVTDRSAGDIVKHYAMTERALLYDWCLANAEYSLRESAERLLPTFLAPILAKNEK